jgi:hypothetical protein
VERASEADRPSQKNQRDELVVKCVRRGIDIETLHVDVPPDMDLFAGAKAEADGARRAAQAMQIPIYSGLTREQIERVAATVRDVLSGNQPAREAVARVP